MSSYISFKILYVYMGGAREACKVLMGHDLISSTTDNFDQMNRVPMSYIQEKNGHSGRVSPSQGRSCPRSVTKGIWLTVMIGWDRLPSLSIVENWGNRLRPTVGPMLGDL